MDSIERALGKEGLRNMHTHISGIDYGPRGEKVHLALKQSKFNYRALLKALKEYGCEGAIISESPELEGDALLLQQEYENI